jgi:hypothetical protein
MRKKLLVLFSIGMLFTQQAVASSQCSFQAPDEIHCSTCTTLNDFALYANKGFSTSSIQVTGNNGSHVIVTKGLFWQPLSFSVSPGRWGSWGVDLSYPSRTLAQVYAQDVNGLVNDPLNNDGRMLYVALNAKCKQIEKEEAAKPENWDWSEIELTLNFSEAYFNSPAWSYLLSATQGYGSLDFYVPYDTCSACGSEPEPGSATAPNAPTMDFDEYNLGFM